MNFLLQNKFEIKLEWGLKGISAIQETVDATIIIDVLSFSTALDIAVGNGAIILPYRWKDNSVYDYAISKNAIVADINRKNKEAYSLSPSSLKGIKKNERLVLPSANGSDLSFFSIKDTYSSCLRNYKAVANHLKMKGYKKILVIPAGEKYHDDISIVRFALEDYLGAGALISELNGTLSPNSAIAKNTFLSFKNEIDNIILESPTGEELIERGYINDIHLALELNSSDAVPQIINGEYVNVG